ncbi:MAG TPA: methyltransferase domain-containing protein [Spirochaetia bacterium]|nr:methyltransferase domain-containing protein [Spirochaetia bacterium]
MRPWHERDEFWETMADHMFTPARLAQAAEDIDHVLQLAAAPRGARVLDLCCGPGRHSLELARRGFTVTAVDRTQAYLDRAAAKARELGLQSVAFLKDDMREFRKPGAFDLVINLFTSFGYFEDPAEDLRVMENIRQSMEPGGKLVMEMLGKEPLAARFRPHDWYEEGGVLFLEDRVLSRDWSWIDTRWIRIEGTRRSEFTLSHRVYSAAELSALARRAGFIETRAFGSLEGIPYDHQASRLVLVATR